MSGRLKLGASYLLVAMFIVACGSKTELKTPPTVVNPVNPTGTTTPIPTTNTLDPRIAEFTKTVTLFLTDFTNFTGLTEVAYPDVIYPVINPDGTKQLVGDGAFIQVQIPNTRNATFENSKLLIAAEDAKGLWWLKMKQFKGTGTQNGTSFDVIFSDDIIVVRVDAVITSGNLVQGNVRYRRRVSGENQCKPVVVTGCSSVPVWHPWYQQYCVTPPDTKTPCLDYMNPNNAQVKTLGTFNANYSDIAILSEGQ